MVKGWRNDPKWIEHYKQCDKERIEREIERVKMDFQSRQLLDDMRRLKQPLPKIISYE